MIAIVGAGLSGLTAAKILYKKNIDFELIEASASIGGRVKTEHIEGFLLDCGFQVLLDSYELLHKYVNLENLKLKSFEPGAQILTNDDKLHTISDPLRSPTHLLSTLFSPIGSFSDKIKILSLKSSLPLPDATSYNHLKKIGFSEKIISTFFRPFFSGVLLEKELESPASFFAFLYNRFSAGLATLPEKGMGQLPIELAKDLSQKRIRLKTKVNAITDEGEIFFSDGSSQKYDKIILAVDALNASKIYTHFDFPIKKRSVLTVYFASNARPVDHRFLFLNASQKGIVNHIAFLSNTQKSYAPLGRHLISVNIIDDKEHSPAVILDEISSWNVFNTKDWTFLKSYLIDYALPGTYYQGTRNNSLSNVILAGDYMENPSIDGAMKSGEKAALQVIGT